MIDYNVFCFSIFFEKREKIIRHVGELFFDKTNLKNLCLSTKITNAYEWINPEGSPMPTFFIGSVNQKDYSVFFSNLTDGWSTAARFLSNRSNCRSIQIRTSSKDNVQQVYSYEVINKGSTERVIQLIKENKFVFFEAGVPLPYEDTTIYKSKKMRERLNSSIIINYLLKEGVHFEELFNDEFSGVELKTISWN